MKLLKLQLPNGRPLSRDPVVLSFLRLLRYGGDTTSGKPKLCITSISKLTGISPTHIRNLLCQQGSDQALHQQQESWKWRKLTKEHIRFLITEDTLFNWAPYTLKQRAVFFHRRFPEVHVSASTIRRVYKEYQIKFKVIRRGKKKIDTSDEPYKSLLSKLMRRVQMLLEEGTPIVFADEAVFTFNTFQSRAWAAKGVNISFEQMSTSFKTQAVLAGFSTDKGLVHLIIAPSSIKTPTYVHFIEEVSRAYGGQKVALFVDNLSVHKSSLSVEAYKRFNIEPVFNLPYSPQYNGIESIFSVVKASYQKLLLLCLVNGRPIRVNDLIKQAFKDISVAKSANCLRHSMKQLMLNNQLAINQFQ